MKSTSNQFLLAALLLINISLLLIVVPKNVRSEPLAGTTERVSIASDGTQGDGESGYASISADGNFVAFHSAASNLVSDDTNFTVDVFVHNRQTGETKRVSVASDGTEANRGAAYPSISADGRFVAFESTADNLVEGDNNGSIYYDVFVHDMQTGQTTRVSVASDGTEGEWGSFSDSPSISADGNYVAFHSSASNLVSNDTNDTVDVFVHDRQTGETTRVSVASDGTQANYGVSSIDCPSISSDGRYVAFTSFASNMVSNDSNGHFDVFVHDRETGETTRVSVASDGTQANDRSGLPSISADGRYIAFVSLANNLVNDDYGITDDIFVHDRLTSQTTHVSIKSDGTEANGGNSGYPSISADGRYIAFRSDADDLIPEDMNYAADIFVHDRLTGQTSLASITADGKQSYNSSLYPDISGNGRFVAFHSLASNIVHDDTNSYTDIFVRDRGEVYFTFLPLIIQN